MDRQVQNFFACRDLDSNDFDEMFEPAKKNLGILGPDEMYGFVPALVFGGPIRFENLEKLKAIEHLVLLSQLCSIEPYEGVRNFVFGHNMSKRCMYANQKETPA
ncbi:aspartyl-tRNA amidotransferase subunit B [Pseudomonas monteilii SB3101]|uniref:Aspartyl-tRNA amidotransferase subunit B n=2 Tax=Pseudomonas putida group TaxID=136845 RepID=V9V283_9PSED|nr:DUF1851 domain-containing protein [Pseudomonas monteilii]AHC83635.1 aspartyl-tRNA amidotransferase subunit B [Pseudomonas monteilii SB3078]AHC89011.1 aspartyl-tRNA amidotransferase subunit B [Pseudomonas monteilii SB3101]